MASEKGGIGWSTVREDAAQKEFEVAVIPPAEDALSSDHDSVQGTSSTSSNQDNEVTVTKSERSAGQVKSQRVSPAGFHRLSQKSLDSTTPRRVSARQVINIFLMKLLLTWLFDIVVRVSDAKTSAEVSRKDVDITDTESARTSRRKPTVAESSITGLIKPLDINQDGTIQKRMFMKVGAYLLWSLRCPYESTTLISGIASCNQRVKQGRPETFQDDQGQSLVATLLTSQARRNVRPSQASKTNPP